MTLIEWTDANGHRWQADLDAADFTPEYIAQSPRTQGMRRIVVKPGGGRSGGMRWERSASVPRRSAVVSRPNTLLPAGSAPETPSEVYGRREILTAARTRQSRLDNGGRWLPLAAVALQARRAGVKRRTLPGIPYMGRQ